MWNRSPWVLIDIIKFRVLVLVDNFLVIPGRWSSTWSVHGQGQSSSTAMTTKLGKVIVIEIAFPPFYQIHPA
jgi:hypothetical protein